MKKIFSFILSIVLFLGIYSISVNALTEGNYTYSVANNEAIITRYLGSESHLVIPDTLGGYPVVKIGMTAFKANRSIISVVVPATVTTLADRAFANCYNLEEITIPYETITIGKYVFENTNIHTVFCGKDSVAEEYFEENYGEVNITLFAKLLKDKAQVRFKIIDSTTVENSFDFRVIAKITEEDWNNWFYNTATDNNNNAIICVGVVAYRGQTANFDLEEAKEIAQNEKSNNIDYGVATTNYISKNDSGIGFGAIIKLNHLTLQNDVIYISFVKYLDKYGAEKIIFFETTYTAPVVTKYDILVEKYLATYA